MAVGAYFDNTVGTQAGSVKVYNYLAGTWSQIGSVILADATGDRFGTSVSLNADGTILAIGAERNSGNGSNAGRTKIYENIGSIWTQIGANIDGEATGDSSGASVDLNDSGNIVAIGAPTNNVNGNFEGHVRLYQDIAGVWTQIGVDIDGISQFEKLGQSVSLNSDGSIVASGAMSNDDLGTNYGKARVYNNTSLSIEDLILNSSNIILYPNPTKGSFYLKFDEIDTYKIVIYNTLDEMVYESILYPQSQEYHINIDDFKSGIYFVKVMSKKGSSIRKIILTP